MRQPDVRWFPYVHGMIHAVVDASSVMAVFSALSIHRVAPGEAFSIVVGYDLLAFAGQVLIGRLSDRLRMPRAAALLGILSVAGAVVALTVQPVAAMLLAGIGNALYHVGAGTLSLHVQPGRAAAPGIFVGPGALGLAFGLWIGKSGPVWHWPFLLVLAAAAVLTFFVRGPALPAARPGRFGTFSSETRTGADPATPALSTAVFHPYVILGLLLLSVGIRSLVGMAGSHALPKSPTLLFALATAAFAGKSLGGIVADRWGWLQTSMLALLVSGPLIAFGFDNATLVVVGMFFFQMTMPATLVAVASLLPGRAGFAFGLACLMLVSGALPTFFPSLRGWYAPWAFFALILASAAALYVALRLLARVLPMRFAPQRGPSARAESDVHTEAAQQKSEAGAGHVGQKRPQQCPVQSE